MRTGAGLPAAGTPRRHDAARYCPAPVPDVTMPRLSDSMEEGTILRWLKADGDQVRAGDELAEIETDKATMTYEAEAEGVLSIVAKEGDTLPIGEVIASARRARPTAPRPRRPPRRTSRPAAAAPARRSADRRALPAVGDADVKASPVARRMAREKGIDLSDDRRAPGPAAGSSRGRRAR